MKVLVLDDHRGFREEVIAMLVRNGHEADEVDNAVAAVPLAASGRYDFVLVDYGMPEHDGLWFMQNVRLPRGTKAILVTGYVNRRLIDRMFSAGIAGYLIKPFEESDLLRHLDFYSSRSSRARVESLVGMVSTPDENSDASATQGEPEPSALLSNDWARQAQVRLKAMSGKTAAGGANGAGSGRGVPRPRDAGMTGGRAASDSAE